MKSYRLILTAEAADDIEVSYHYYEEQQAGLGERFKGKLDETFVRICANPEMFNVAEDSIRHAVLKTFPFVVVFEIVADEIRVYSVFHTSRNPRKKYRRT